MIDIQSDSVLKKKSFKSAVVPFQNLPISLPPNAPHQTMRDNHLDNIITMMTKFFLISNKFY